MWNVNNNHFFYNWHLWCKPGITSPCLGNIRLRHLSGTIPVSFAVFMVEGRKAAAPESCTRLRPAQQERALPPRFLLEEVPETCQAQSWLEVRWGGVFLRPGMAKSHKHGVLDPSLLPPAVTQKINNVEESRPERWWDKLLESFEHQLSYVSGCPLDFPIKKGREKGSLLFE